MLIKLLSKRYQVVQVLSQGMFCKTYVAEDTHLPHRPLCVIKHFLPGSEISIPVEIRRRLFNRETQALQKLGDYDLVPHLLTYFEDDHEFYLVQQFIAGHTLSTELQPGCCWTQSQVIQLLREVLEILDFVHSHGLIHRDVKPSNIMRRTSDNRLVLIDFGAVKPILTQLVKNQKNLVPIEYSTIAIGTPGYMPSEQQRGRPRPNSDIYALGMIAIQALTGVHPTQLPENRKTGEIIWQHLAKVNVEFAAVINKMVCYHFQDRYKSAKEVLEALLPHINNQDATLLSTFSSQSTLSVYQSHSILSNTISAPLLEKPTSIPETSVIPKNSPLVVGLVIGVVSGLILMVVSYWSLQIISPEPNIQNSLPTPGNINR
ncbi:serine/threonine-protein kinase [Nostoc sp. FACHB-280]|uniref:serine/threonine-protein kinase n=1 Tax=Nostoc sp. FACHB-280 TaxID=2692839 RepID=UPI00168AEB82|nr:serine/threonine-protein kinase [Nostoc sp. FACHB-280]MBD2498505.1 serine/threonine protein kinase [Nostoc sp. FACHB-280]